MRGVARILESPEGSSYRLDKELYNIVVDRVLMNIPGLVSMHLSPDIDKAAEMLEKALSRHKAKEALKGDYDQELRRRHGYAPGHATGHVFTGEELKQLLDRATHTDAWSIETVGFPSTVLVDLLQDELKQDVRAEETKLFGASHPGYIRRLNLMAYPGGLATVEYMLEKVKPIRDLNKLGDLVKDLAPRRARPA